jgi:transglutaminase-like putative cysteine protease
MNRPAALTGLALLLVGLGLFLWKTQVLGLPVLPSNPEGLWRVELEISARGEGQRGSLRAALPSSGPGQVIFDEHSRSDGLAFTIRSERGQRRGVWRGRFQGVHTVVHGFRASLGPVTTPLPRGPTEPPPKEIAQRYATPLSDLRADTPVVEDLFAALRVPASDDRVGQLRLLFGFVSDEIATVATGSEDPALTLAAREGRPEGQAQLLVALLRAAGIPARPVLGLRLRAGSPTETVVWVEAWIDGSWIPMSPSDGFLAERPADLLQLQTGSLSLVETTSVAAVGYGYQALREHLRPEELAAMMLPTHPLLARFSLYRLPVPTQAVLRALLLFPLGALIVAVYRNLIGVPTFGTFMPLLIAYALRSTSLGPGLALVGAVILLGIAGRLFLERLRLLLVPRLAILLCVVVLAVTAFALAGRTFGNRDLTTGVLFPLVILTMLIERFSVTLAEEGLRESLVRIAYSTLVAVSVYPLFHSALAEHLMFGFPELVVVVIGCLVLIGGYTGYRVTDWIRFRAAAAAIEGSRP